MSSNTAIATKSLAEYLYEIRGEFCPVIQIARPWVALDLSANNAALQRLGIIDTHALSSYIFSEIAAHGAHVGYGGYDEDRRWYQRSEIFSDGEEPRTIHIGVDLWCAPGTPVFAPTTGRVHSFQDNAAFADYGPTIILEHSGFATPYYTLYGHLTRESLDGLHVGKVISRGEQFATIGAPPINGDWPPHLHFQIISDMLGKRGDFPAVAAASRRTYFLDLCPDPNLILQIE